jgi:hypothetical protein
MTSRGGVKATQLAGAILNHKDDKQGHHDVFRWWWTKNVGTQMTFPDTSNNRFQSHCEAAGVLLLHLDHFIAFLDYIHKKKNDMRFSHMEENLWKALHCTATKTELAVLALYSQAITHPYMRIICAPNQQTNMLNLGPQHAKVLAHMQRIIGDPTFLVGPNATCEMGAMDGQPWQAPAVFEAIQKMASQLPHLQQLLVTFCEGAAETWKRFTSEFAPGGLIDEATVEEKDLAWMPPTNDVNEGALGSFRVLMRRQPQLTVLQYNAQAMFFHNNTQAFMDTKLTELEDQQFIHKLAREATGEQRKWKEQLIQHTETKIAQKEERARVRKEKAAVAAQCVASVKLVFDKDEVRKLKGQNLKDHFRAFKAAGAPNLQEMCKLTLNRVKLH